MVTYILAFFVLLPLVLTFMFIAIVCYMIGRWRFGTACVFLTINFVRQFAFYLAVATGVLPKEGSITYAALSTDFGASVISGGILVFSLWSIWDSFHNMGGIKGARTMVAQARFIYKVKKRVK